MTNKRLHEQYASGFPHEVAKKAKLPEPDTMPSTANIFLDDHCLFQNAASTVGSYDFSDFNCNPQSPHVPDKADPNQYPFCEYIGAGYADSQGIALDSQLQSSAPLPLILQQSSDLSSIAQSYIPADDGRNKPTIVGQSYGSFPTEFQPETRITSTAALTATPENNFQFHRTQNTTAQANQMSNTNASTRRSVKNVKEQEATSADRNSDTTAVEDNESVRKQEDRAARNRESSRRAREKAKGKLKHLEAEVVGLREQCHSYRIQIEALSRQAAQATCGYCGCSVMQASTNLVPTRLTGRSSFAPQR